MMPEIIPITREITASSKPLNRKPVVPRSIGIASSVSAANSAISVETVMSLLEKRSAAVTDSPHMGISPATAPSTGPFEPREYSLLVRRSLASCSINSINKYDAYRKGISLAESSIASIRASKITSYMGLLLFF